MDDWKFDMKLYLSPDESFRDNNNRNERNKAFIKGSLFLSDETSICPTSRQRFSSVKRKRIFRVWVGVFLFRVFVVPLLKS